MDILRRLSLDIDTTPFLVFSLENMDELITRYRRSINNLALTFFVLLALSVLFLIKEEQGMRKPLQKLSAIAQAQSEASFTFTAVGDYAESTTSSAMLREIGRTAPSLNLALGDLSYSTVAGSEPTWCQFVKDRLNEGASKAQGDPFGETFPFELIGGNHEDFGNAVRLENFASCLPDRIGATIGTYGKEYYFDYPKPPATTLARFIMISPSISYDENGNGTLDPGETYSYNQGTPHYTFIVNAIDDARALGISWVIVGMHKNCISTGVKSCEIGQDVLNLFIDKKVDLILQGHEHDYQRSRQLALGGSCTSLVPGSFSSACIVDDGEDNVYEKGAGTVLVVVGTGGRNLHTINTDDSEAGYFVRWMGKNVTPRHGFSSFTVTGSQLSGSFVGATDTSTFTDSFAIGTNLPPIPTPTPVPDTTPPSVVWKSPPDNSYVKGANLTLKATASDNVGISHVDFLVDGVFLATDTLSPYTTTWNTKVLPDGGVHILWAQGFDPSGNSATSSASHVTIDKTLPTVTTTSPQNGSQVPAAGTFAIAATAEDNTGVKQVVFRVNDVFVCKDTTSPYTCDWSVPAGSGILYTIKAIATDLAGNTRAASITATSQ